MATVQRTVCLKDCTDVCALQVTVTDGAVTAVTGDPDHPPTAGFICAKVGLYPERLRSPDRVLYPLVRTGPKGSGQFRRVTWDEAIGQIASRWSALIDRHGAEVILPYSFFGSEGILSAQGFDRRFFHALGASKLDRTICASAGRLATRFTIGSGMGIPAEHQRDLRFLILWGKNVAATNIHHVPSLLAARRQGCRVVLIDPVPGPNASLADTVLTPIPGTDAALALGLMHVIIREELYDRTFVAQHTLGFEALAARVEAYPPERVAAVTGVPAAAIMDLARTYARTHPSMIRVGVGVLHTRDGDAAVRNMACLTGLTGAWQYPGGGMAGANAAPPPINFPALERPDLAPPEVRTLNMCRLGQALLSAEPPVLSLYVYGSNPVVVAPGQREVLAGLQREDLFVVVHEQMLTDTARFADIVLPACSQFEHEDLAFAGVNQYVHYNAKLLEPTGECKPNTEVFRLLARALGLTEPSLYDSDEVLMRTALDHPDARTRGITLEALRERGWMQVRKSEETRQPFQGRFPTPSGKLEFYSQRLADLGLDPLPFCLPPTPDDQHPLHFVARASRYFTNSTFANLPPHQRREAARPTLWIHPADGAARGIGSGDLVRVFNANGECQLHAAVTDGVRPGVVSSTGRWWLRDMPGGAGVNALSDQTLSPLGGGPTFNSTRVEVARAE